MPKVTMTLILATGHILNGWHLLISDGSGFKSDMWPCGSVVFDTAGTCHKHTHTCTQGLLFTCSIHG